jgi:coenzyme F420-reducing hydrogenase alpha subunit
MSTKILLKKATRIEGNADIQIEVQDGRVETARFMVQDFRGFEKLTQGKMVESVPHIVSRICGLCSTAHQVAGIRAIEDALGIEVPAPVRKLREIAIWGEWIASHALSYFFLTLPDMLGTGGGIFDLMRTHPDVAADAFYLRRSGDRIVEIVGKRPVHAVALGVGRFNILPTADELDEIRAIAGDVRELTGRLIDRLGAQPQRHARIPFPAGHSVNFMSYGGRSGQERFRVYNQTGKLRAEFDRETFGDYVSEMRVDWSLSKFPYLADLGFPDGILLVGPLSRLFLEGGILDDPDLASFELTRWLGDPATLCLDCLDECRLLEVFWAAKQILLYLDEVDLTQIETGDIDLDGSGWGIGVVEAPRGTLVHNYTIGRGVIERMRLLVATQFNNAYINLVLRDLAERHVDGEGLSEAGEQITAHCIRVFDPCLTCATH